MLSLFSLKSVCVCGGGGGFKEKEPHVFGNREEPMELTTTTFGVFALDGGGDGGSVEPGETAHGLGRAVYEEGKLATSLGTALLAEDLHSLARPPHWRRHFLDALRSRETLEVVEAETVDGDFLI